MADGIAEALSLIDRLPQDARREAGFFLGELTFEVSAAQKAAVARRTGHLSTGLDTELLLAELRSRMGLLKTGKGRNSYYYGRFVELGRRPQNVLVTRGTSVSDKSASTRRRRKLGLAVRKPYTMRVKAMAPRPFVNLPDVDLRVQRRFAEFWSEILT